MLAVCVVGALVGLLGPFCVLGSLCTGTGGVFAALGGCQFLPTTTTTVKSSVIPKFCLTGCADTRQCISMNLICRCNVTQPSSPCGIITTVTITTSPTTVTSTLTSATTTELLSSTVNTTPVAIALTSTTAVSSDTTTSSTTPFSEITMTVEIISTLSTTPLSDTTTIDTPTISSTTYVSEFTTTINTSSAATTTPIETLSTSVTTSPSDTTTTLNTLSTPAITIPSDTTTLLDTSSVFVISSSPDTTVSIDTSSVTESTSENASTITDYISGTTIEITTSVPAETSTATTTATPSPPKCFYTLHRRAQLVRRRRSLRAVPENRFKRLVLATDVAKNCQYPGIVIVINASNTPAQQVLGHGILLDERHVLLSSFAFSKIRSSTNITAQISSYQLKNIDTTKSLNGSSAVRLNNMTGLADLYVATLNTAVNFDTACVLPACLPNSRILTSEIDFNNCRVVGSGVYDDTDLKALKYPQNVQEVLVKITGNLTSKLLTFVRIDSAPTIGCVNDAGSSVICPILGSGEWITVGMLDKVSYPCLTGALSNATIINLLPGSPYYNNLQSYPYTTPS